jgi:N-acetylmuramoyl-L-alanine amidase
MGKIPIFLSPSQQPENICKSGDTEQDHCRKICNELISILQRDSRFVTSISSIVSGTVPEKCWNVVYQSNDFITVNGGSGYHFCLHTNAGGWQGCSGFFTGNGSGKKATRACLDRLNDISPWKEHEFREYSELIEMNSIASTIYLEVNFHDNLEQSKWIHNNIKIIAQQAYKGLCDAESISYLEEAINPVVTPPIDTNLWKKEAIQEAIKLGLLTDNSWINKFDEPIPVFAVSLMLTRLKTLIDNSIDKIISDKINSILQEESIKILKKK